VTEKQEVTEKHVKEVQWIVSDGNEGFGNGEFGVLVEGKPYFYYKWPTTKPSEGVKYRAVEKREFGEVIRREVCRAAYDGVSTDTALRTEVEKKNARIKELESILEAYLSAVEGQDFVAAGLRAAKALAPQPVTADFVVGRSRVRDAALVEKLREVAKGSAPRVCGACKEKKPVCCMVEGRNVMCIECCDCIETGKGIPLPGEEGKKS